MCRENTVASRLTRIRSGTSLRVQGELRAADRQLNLGRNIPACAGRTAQQAARCAGPLEHPCVCRENFYYFDGKLQAAGTSLRVQGEHSHTPVKFAKRRNIPACAGRTLWHDRPLWPDAEHPCVCRENQSPLVAIDTIPGTSLRVQGEHARRRGTSLRVQGEHHGAAADVTHERNIPACAGRTHSRAIARLRLVEHPCVCRENPARVSEPALLTGTSLRVQGERPPRLFAASRGRNIPACAGRTICTQELGASRLEHPCVCRENT